MTSAENNPFRSVLGRIPDPDRFDVGIQLFDLLDAAFYHRSRDDYMAVVRPHIFSMLVGYNKQPYCYDPRLIRIWRRCCEFSQNTGYMKLLENVMNKGYFTKNLDFYKMWAELAIQANDQHNVVAVKYLAEQNCSDRKAVLDAFEKYLPSENAPKESPARRASHPSAVPRTPLSTVKEENSTRSGNSTRGSSASETDHAATPHVQAAEKERENEKQPPPAEPTPPRVPNFSFTTNCVRSKFTDFGDTLPHSQEPGPTAAEDLVIDEQKFDVFVDTFTCQAGDLMPGDQQPGNPQGPDFEVFNEPTGPPVGKTFTVPEKSADGTAQKTYVVKDAAEHSFDIPADNSFNSPATKKHRPYESPLFHATDCVTVSAVDKNAMTVAFSTPVRGSAKPKISLSPVAKSNPAGQEPFPEPQPFRPRASLAPKPDFSFLKDDEDFGSPVAGGDVVDEVKKLNLNETTIDEAKCSHPVIPVDSVNPWSELERKNILDIAPPMPEMHEFTNQRCPTCRDGATIDLGGEKFSIKSTIAQGGFAKILRVVSEDNKTLAAKLQMPACPWEVYVCKSLSMRLPENRRSYVMSITDAYVFANGSLIVYDYEPHGSLLDLSNNFHKDEKNTLNGTVVGLLASQMAETVAALHAADIIHADLKPDNWLICGPISEGLPAVGRQRPVVKLIDFGRSIDMSFFPGRLFKGRAGTSNFDCSEMIDGRPWTFQTDFYSFAGTIYVLLFGTYMEVYRDLISKQYEPSVMVKARTPLSSIWRNMFRVFLNIPDCGSQPSWTDFITELDTALDNFVKGDPVTYRQAVDRTNRVIRSHCAK